MRGSRLLLWHLGVAAVTLALAFSAEGCGGSKSHGGGGGGGALPPPSPPPPPVTAISMPAAQASGSNQSAQGEGNLVSGSQSGKTLANPLIVTVVDQGGNPVSGATVTFTVTSQPTGGLARFSNAPVPLPAGFVDFLNDTIGSGAANAFSASNGRAGAYLVPGVGSFSGANTITVTATFNGLSAPALQFTATGQ